MWMRRAQVLLAEDDTSITEFLRDALVDEGYVVRTAINGRHALDLLDEWRPDLILLDLKMPEMDGWAFRAEQLKRQDVADIPVIVLTATHAAVQPEPSHDTVAIVHKPFDLDDLLETIRQHLGPG
jgi:CheY-like chemotaxis protein